MEEKKTVLIVEDEKSIVDIVRFNLEKEGYATLTAYDGETGLAMALEKNPDIVLLDVMLPKMIGFDVCRILREKGSSVPVIILTAREEEADKVQGLEIGADDYITKPFNPVLLGAKVKALLRRSKTSQGGGQPVQAGPFVYHSDTMRLEKNGREVALSAKESVMIKLFLDHVGQVFTKEQLYQHVWGEVLVDPNAVMVYISHLRNKLEEDPKNPRYLRTVWGMGYKFVVEEA